MLGMARLSGNPIVVDGWVMARVVLSIHTSHSLVLTAIYGGLDNFRLAGLTWIDLNRAMGDCVPSPQMPVEWLLVVMCIIIFPV